ncbi:FtsQ-type POTRA domain-containing protein [Ktedonosporobacter rubrisoli]|uniref:FtsQ-type POTRA domain-containing protein n=1 Tax=Ktedonosporobacter rubrisoli TaxID=2509675 RepID=A0A4P6JZL7_KTERU|nr:FtsQ-type POTRA domain-containing protein [Ktedonosporobacter rubrisoli]QBD81194.1 FtsQ-type POTRA domain-containing protein [Ktedonosporobacter rubrisoli]
MTEKKRIPEQMAAHSYRQQVPVRRPYQAERREATRKLQRVVTIPDADPSTAWNTFAQRQEQRRQARAQPRKYVRMVARTYAQTGTQAPHGRRRVVHRSLASHHSSPVPVRSGRRGKRGFLWRLLSLLAVCLVLLVGASFLLSSSAFRIAQVSVSGTHNSVLIHNIQSMGMQGQNIFLVDVEALTQHIEASPLVASASLSKQWPDQLAVSVSERTPVLLWQTAQGTYAVDRQGVIIAPVTEISGAAQLHTVVEASPQQKEQGKAAPAIRPGMRLQPVNIAFAAEIFDLLPKMTGINAFKLLYDGTMYVNANDEPGAANGNGSYRIESSTGWIAYLGGEMTLIRWRTS